MPLGGRILFGGSCCMFWRLGALFIGSSIKYSAASFSALDGPSVVSSGAAVESNRDDMKLSVLQKTEKLKRKSKYVPSLNG